MKLIIDIPDEQYEFIKRSDKNAFEIVSSKECMLYAIKNGIPYEEKLTGKYKIACNVLLDLEQITRHSVGWEDSAIEAVHNAVQTAIEALEFAESQRLCCDNCVNRNYKSKEVCTSPYGMCEFFEDKNQEGDKEE